MPSQLDTAARQRGNVRKKTAARQKPAQLRISLRVKVFPPETCARNVWRVWIWELFSTATADHDGVWRALVQFHQAVLYRQLLVESQRKWVPPSRTPYMCSPSANIQPTIQLARDEICLEPVGCAWISTSLTQTCSTCPLQGIGGRDERAPDQLPIPSEAGRSASARPTWISTAVGREG